MDFSYCSATQIASARETRAAWPASGAPFGGWAGRLHERNFAPPKARHGDVVRERILARTAGERARRIVAIDGPAGCGKTTFAAQECALDVRPTAWLNLRDLDNDPVRLLDAPECARWVRSKFSIHDSLRVSRRRAQCKERQSCYWDCSARLTGAPPVQLVLDDVHALHESASIEVLRSLVGEWPARSRLVLVSRIEPDVSLARLRVVHDLSEVHFADLALHEHETAEVLDRAGAHWQESAVEELHSRTEGWVTGVALAAMASSEAGTSTAPIELSGKSHEVADYFFDEVLRQQPSVLREFMLSTSVLHRFSAPLCDAMMNRSDSASVLAQLERDNAFVVPLDGQRTWYRYHHLFQEMLRAELDRQHPKVSQDLLARAADWHELHGSADEAFEYGRVIGDFDRAAACCSAIWRTT